MSEAKRQVTLAYPYPDPESGKTLKPDSTHSLPIEAADRLVAAGLAREPEAATAAKGRRKPAAKSTPNATSTNADTADTKEA